MDKIEKLLRKFCDEQSDCEKCPLYAYACFDSTGGLNISSRESFESIAKMVDIYREYMEKHND